jgi:hypothetical protein
MNDFRNKTTRCDAEFGQQTEAQFAAFAQAAISEHLDWVGVEDPHIDTFSYRGVILDKPALRILVGDAEFKVIFIKT